ncbi:MAG: CDP-diacylglycerol--glycerol-3-phosphate 3-phosphatidyltransferase [Deltaproteobacteria bacterium]|nr:CDP-diacylglycerol--glycerol-3-phosphate 3-phosphatidyltransferase [Deltaproteobacteria bacterium]
MNSTLRAELSSLPNRVTLGRIALVPLLMITLRWDDPFWNTVGAAIFALGWTTDLVDGWLARRFNNVTSLGKFLDPLADKLLVASALIMMIPLDRVPAWAAVVIIGRELAVTSLRGIASSQGHVMAASSWGKHKSFVQYFAITCLILAWDKPIDLIRIGQWVLYLAVVLTLWSGYTYIRSYAQADLTLEGRS